MNFWGHIFTIFLPEKSDFNLHKRLLAKEWPKLARFQKVYKIKLPDSYYRLQ
jgi:hypothetical protein